MLKCCKRYKRDLPLFGLPRSGRPPTLERRHFDFIKKLEQNDELILMPFFTYIFTCLCLQFVNIKVKMERIAVYMRNRESALKECFAMASSN